MFSGDSFIASSPKSQRPTRNKPQRFLGTGLQDIEESSTLKLMITDCDYKISKLSISSHEDNKLLINAVDNLRKEMYEGIAGLKDLIEKLSRPPSSLVIGSMGSFPTQISGSQQQTLAKHMWLRNQQELRCSCTASRGKQKK